MAAGTDGGETMTKRSGRRGGGRAARRAERTGGKIEHLRYITRDIPSVDLLSEEGLALVEENAETILEEIGIEFREDAEALELFKDAGADIDGERVRFPRGLARHLVSTAPASFTQLARNPKRSVEMGGRNLVFAPVYGPPFIYDIEKGRRYAQLEDFENIVRLAYMTPAMHHSGGTVCEPVDVPVNKRHLDMVYAHMRYSDKPFMGSVTHPERAADSVEMAKILFGADVVDSQTVMVSLINANSPMTFDATMLGALKVYARANQGLLVTPFILAGAMAPVSLAGTMAQTLAEATAGMALVQLCRPGAPVIFGSFLSSMSMQTGAPTFGTPEATLAIFGLAALARRLGVPLPQRRIAHRVQAPRRAGGLRERPDPAADGAGGHQLRAPRRRLAGRRTGERLREVRHGRRPDGHDAGAVGRLRPLGQRSGDGRDPGSRPRQPLPRLRPHAGEFRDRLLPLHNRRQFELRAVAGGGLQGRDPRGRTISTSRCWPTTRRPPSTPASTKRSRSSSPRKRRPCPTRSLSLVSCF